MLRIALLIGALLATTAMAWPPATFLGKPVKEKGFLILGDQQVTLHVTESGPIPEESDKLRFDFNNPKMARPTPADGRPPRFVWSFAIELLRDVKPTHVSIDDVTGKTAIALVDDGSPMIKTFGKEPAWLGEQISECIIQREAPCSAWLFRSGMQWFVFRATVTFDDGSTEVLYQAAAFEPDRMGPVFKWLGVDR